MTLRDPPQVVTYLCASGPPLPKASMQDVEVVTSAFPVHAIVGVAGTCPTAGRCVSVLGAPMLIIPRAMRSAVSVSSAARTLRSAATTLAAAMTSRSGTEIGSSGSIFPRKSSGVPMDMDTTLPVFDVEGDTATQAVRAHGAADFELGSGTIRVSCRCGWQSSPIPNVTRLLLDAWTDHLLGVAADETPSAERSVPRQ